jgi:hypothetical protein
MGRRSNYIMTTQYEPSQQIAVVDQETGEVRQMPSTLDGIARLQTGGLTGAVKTSLDMSKPADQVTFDEMRQYQAQPDHKQNDGWYGQPFTMAAYLCQGYLGKRNAQGEMLGVPEPRIRTVIKSGDGRYLVSSSSYLYESLMIAVKTHQDRKETGPLILKLVKAGPTDQLQRVHNAGMVNPNAKQRKG